MPIITTAAGAIISAAAAKTTTDIVYPNTKKEIQKNLKKLKVK